jgi:hypothetical protein
MAYRGRITKQFNQVSPENVLKFQPKRPLRVRRGNTLRTFDTRRGAALTLVGADLRAAGRR